MIAATSNLNFCNPLTAVPQAASALWSCLEPIIQKILSIVAYPITLLKNLFGFNAAASDGVYFVRYINGEANLHRLIQATK